MNPSSKLKKIREYLTSEKHQSRSPNIQRSITLSEKIYWRRQDLGITQTELASRLGTTQRIISELENAFYTPNKWIWDQFYDKLSEALEIDRDYLVSDKITRRSFELFAYLSKKIWWNWDIMKFMKLPYFVDYMNVRKHGFQITNFEYIRWHFGPFDSKVYAYSGIFEWKDFNIKFSYIEDYINDIDKTIQELPVTNSKKLKELSYSTGPMKALWAKLGGNEHMGEKLDLTL